MTARQIIIGLLISIATLHAEPIITDRPDFTESNATAPLKTLQIENGYTYESPESHTVGEVLLRYGLTPKIELRLTLPSYQITDNDQGLSDTGIGVKWMVTDDIAFILQGTLATGAPAFREGESQIMTKLCLGWDLPQEWSAGANINYGWVSSGETRFNQFSGSVTAGHALTDKTSMFVEYYGFFPEEKRGDTSHVLSSGLTYLISDDIQLDVRAGKTLTDHSWFVGIGSAVRVPL